MKIHKGREVGRNYKKSLTSGKVRPDEHRWLNVITKNKRK